MFIINLKVTLRSCLFFNSKTYSKMIKHIFDLYINTPAVAGKTCINKSQKQSQKQEQGRSYY